MFGDDDLSRDPERQPTEVAGHADREHDATDGAGDLPVPEMAPTPPVTGDEAVDEAMMRLAQAQAGSFAERIDSGEHAHRSLQSRLGGLGGA
ncbi:hypothetical protein [Terrabacter sp. NPDC080008]|uniref:hypothetical protein n=1 Tax=Terrabacter sp. NPDC080008 TaxID=3155176 RepID=UPI00345009FC